MIQNALFCVLKLLFKRWFAVFIRFAVFCSCLLACSSSEPKSDKAAKGNLNLRDTSVISEAKVVYDSFSRDALLRKLKSKKKQKGYLVAHAFVPLCDNIHQGIVPVNERLGDGKNLITNLYWGAGYGMKSYFKKRKDWSLLYSKKLNDTILERVVFGYQQLDSVMVYLVADAYAGNHMVACLEDYFASFNKACDSVKLENGDTLPIYNQADLLIFNGHNGLMDVPLPLKKTTIAEQKEAVVIACYSRSYFQEHLFYGKAYPLVTTTHLLAPEAYTIDAILKSWANENSATEVRNAAAKAYSDKHSCTYKTAQRLFNWGW